MALDRFSPAVREWFTTSFAEPTPAQAQGWPAIAAGDHTLILAPTGSGKTLAAFLWGLDQVASAPPPDGREARTRVLYISPLRALAVDVERNLRAPLKGIALAAERLGVPVNLPSVGMRTGDTTPEERRQLVRHPPDVLITTPESLFLMLTSQARETLRGVETVIVDEIHAMAATKRGAHLAVSLERLHDLVVRAGNPAPQRIGLSATQRPLDEIARFLGGTGRPVTIVDAGTRKEMDLEVVVPVEDMGRLGEVLDEPASGPAAAAPARSSIWPSIHPRLLELIREHRSTLIFVNARRLAERLAARLNELAEGGEDPDGRPGTRRARRWAPGAATWSRPTTAHSAASSDSPSRTSSSRGPSRPWWPPARSSSASTWAPSTSWCTSSRPGRWPAASSGSAGPATRSASRAGASSSRSTGATWSRRPWSCSACARASSRRRATPATPSTCWRSRWWPCAPSTSGGSTSSPTSSAGPPTSPSCPTRPWPPSSTSCRGATRARSSPSCAPGWCGTGWRPAGRASCGAGPAPNGWPSPTPAPSRTAASSASSSPTGPGWASSTRRWSTSRRPGETFLLGASTWRIEEITHDRVIVTPAPGEPGKMPFWHGDRPGRPLELGRAVGEFLREVRRPGAVERLQDEFGLDPWAADNLVRYVEEQAEATGHVPDDRTIVVERFRDEIGDWRVCILSPFGARVHAPWAMAIEARLADRLGMAVQAIWSDDGIVLRLPESEESIPVDELLIDPDEIEELVLRALPETGLFASRFRENAARALLLPRRDPGSRTPLWQQRQRSADLLRVASRYPSFPILLETTRECLRDVFDLPALTSVLTDLRSHRIRMVSVDTPKASPFAGSLLFGWVGVYMYEGDAPLAERRAAALALDRDLLRELLGAEELRELLDPDVLADLELELQCLTDGRRARDLDELHDLLRRLGDLTLEEIGARAAGDAGPWAEQLVNERRAMRVQMAGETRLAAAEDAARLRDALGVPVPPGLPAAYLAPVDQPLDELCARYARTHGPFVTSQAAHRLGTSSERVLEALTRLELAGRVVRGEFRPGGSEREWCDEEVLRVLRRRSLAALRREVEPVDGVTLARFLPAWHAVGERRRGLDALSEAIGRLQGAALPASVLETDVLPVRVEGYRPSDLDLLCSAGEVVWLGAGTLGGADGRVALYRRDQVALLAPAPADERPDGALHERLRAHLAERGASFWPELARACSGDSPATYGSLDERAVLAALWDLVWAGEVTNDTMAPLRALVAGGAGARRRVKGRPRPGRLTRLGPPSGAGRWSLVATLLEPAPTPTERAHARARALLERHGVLAREAVLAEGVEGGFAGVYGVLKALEETGGVRRGYFVAGLGAAQFALPGAVDRLRAERPAVGAAPAGPPPAALVLAATDPANPYGAALPWPDRPGGRPSRAAGAYVVLVDGEPAAYLERGGRSLVTFPAAEPSGSGSTAWCRW